MRDQEDILKKVMKKRTSVKSDGFFDLERERKNREELMEHESDILQKIKLMLEVSKRISLDRMQDVLEMEKKPFNKRIFELAKQFGFIIDGDYLIVNRDTVSDFIDSLERTFKEWEETEKDKNYKIK
ncbi:hypothetical protein LCGC14_1030220 [marine sediment metagenome]|uniref:Uncharacterized protein n=1 Tax=marine sediment metagenome TaxID=412755 RepID=A0A0F9R0P0_9ZZZZ